MFLRTEVEGYSSSTDLGMLRQARLHQGFGGQAQHDEVVILGKVNRGGAEELLKGQGRGGQNHGGHSVIFTTVTARDRVNVYTLGSP